jgi:hypothetical protein
VLTQILAPRDREKLKSEVVSDSARLKLTRLLRRATTHPNSDVAIIHINRVVNIARAPMGLPVYVLDSGGDESYQPVEHAWHFGELELAMRRPPTPELSEVLADLVAAGCLSAVDVNSILEEDRASFRVKTSRASREDVADVRVEVLSDEEIESAPVDDEHPNVRALIRRMDVMLVNKDWPGVLHASASVFETIAKSVVNLSGVNNQSLGGFLSRYRKDSRLPGPLLDYIEAIYKRRNTEPLAGHGQIDAPSITGEEATVLAEVTRLVVRLERQLAQPAFNSVDLKK